MANNVTIPVQQGFELSGFAERLAQLYRTKGYTVNVQNMNGYVTVTIEKNTDGFTHLLGLSESIHANCFLQGGLLQINFSDEPWVWKIGVIAVGFFLCFIPLITGIIGCVQQYSLSESIANDARLLAMSNG